MIFFKKIEGLQGRKFGWTDSFSCLCSDFLVEGEGATKVDDERERKLF